MVRRVANVPKLYPGDPTQAQTQEPQDRAISDLQKAPQQRQHLHFGADAAAGGVASVPLLLPGGQKVRVERIVINVDAPLAPNATNFKALRVTLGARGASSPIRVLYTLSTQSQALDPKRDYDTGIAAFNLESGQAISQERAAFGAGAIFPGTTFTLYFREL